MSTMWIRLCNKPYIHYHLLHILQEEDVTEEEREAMVGKTIMVKFLARDEEDDKITFSAKRAGVGAVIMDDFKIGDVVEGIVSRVVEYGAFIDVVEGNGQGLLHISQVSHDRITNITDLLDIGDKIKVSATPSLSFSCYLRILKLLAHLLRLPVAAGHGYTRHRHAWAFISIAMYVMLHL
jgi:predicted RNA-binding protein with RPS1 domain